MTPGHWRRRANRESAWKAVSRKRRQGHENAKILAKKFSQAIPGGHPAGPCPDWAHRTGFPARPRDGRGGRAKYVCDAGKWMPALEFPDAPTNHTSKFFRRPDTPHNCRRGSVGLKNQSTPRLPREVRPDIQCALPTWRASRQWAPAPGWNGSRNDGVPPAHKPHAL
jgi:hypothetical protein